MVIIMTGMNMMWNTENCFEHETDHDLETLLLNETEHNDVWDRIDSEFHFVPDCYHTKHRFDKYVPFVIDVPHTVYSIEKVIPDDEQPMNCLLLNLFSEFLKKGYSIYALDWNHDCYWFSPDAYTSDGYALERHSESRDCNMYYPSFYPNGDYHFFIEKDFKFGMLGHPWRQEMWVFGEQLLPLIATHAEEMGWEELRRVPNPIV